ncbi:MAG: SHOCT domain-containing protein [Actinobacteria bacterium]|nr:SHOCT domain-containing protein [Actinomycetota bacterium]
MMFFGFIFIIPIIIGIILLVLWFIRGTGFNFDFINKTGVIHSVEILKERYAKGEITKEQYESMKKDLT